jgi:deazaflavin-dependent oxidoreductase (nitroreductase family)
VTPPASGLFISIVARLNRVVYRLTGGAIGGRLGRAPILLLTTSGRKSGAMRETPLLFLRDGDEFVVVASNVGRPTYPDWYLNLRHDPHAAVRIRREVTPVVAREAAADERARLWLLLTEMYADFNVYVRRTQRPIPVVVLSPAGAARPHG